MSRYLEKLLSICRLFCLNADKTVSKLTQKIEENLVPDSHASNLLGAADISFVVLITVGYLPIGRGG